MWIIAVWCGCKYKYKAYKNMNKCLSNQSMLIHWLTDSYFDVAAAADIPGPVEQPHDSLVLLDDGHAKAVPDNAVAPLPDLPLLEFLALLPLPAQPIALLVGDLRGAAVAHVVVLVVGVLDYLLHVFVVLLPAYAQLDYLHQVA